MAWLDGNSQGRVVNWADAVGQSFKIFLRSYVESDQQSMSVFTAHASELDGAVLVEQFLVLQKVFLAFFFRERSEAISILASADQLALRLQTLWLLYSCLVV